MPQPIWPGLDRLFAELAGPLAQFAEYVRETFGAITEQAARQFGLLGHHLTRTTRAEDRARRATTPTARRQRRAERRRQQRLLRQARRAHSDAGRSHRRRARRHQQTLQLVRYRGHPARTGRLTGNPQAH